MKPTDESAVKPNGHSSVIVTIDGPAGAGKSSVARQLAQRLGFDFLDTGAMYRAVALAALRQDVAPTDNDVLRQLLERIEIRQAGTQTSLNGEDVSQEIRSPVVANAVSRFAGIAPVRQRLTEMQRATVADRNVVTEGRDQGTIVFPHARCKIFLTASELERAGRRHKELLEKGVDSSLESVLDDQRTRDTLDSQRELAPLRPAPDSVVVDTTGLALSDVVDQLLAIATKTCIRENASFGQTAT